MEEQGEPIHIVAVDDDEMILKAITSILEAAGHRVTAFSNAREAMDQLPDLAPDCVISDLMMPDIDGFQLCKFVRAHELLKDTVFIVLTAKSYEFDVNRSYEFGANGFIRKPIVPATFLEKVDRILRDDIELSFWGVRGTLPVSGEGTLKYGGNTNCVTLQFPRDQIFIFDGGTGIKTFGDKLMANGKRNIRGRIFISHPHWDHINAIPFFAPLYRQGNEFQVFGANQGDISIREIISAQMDGVYFPITLKEFAARVYFRDLDEEELEVDGIRVKTKLLSHPGKCLGFRVEYNGRSICYVTDNEMFFETHEAYNPHYEEKLAEFVHGADALITDTTYTDAEYASKVTWGHSCISKVVELADRAKVKNLFLYHHDPDQRDSDIDDKLETARTLLRERGSDTVCIAPKERETFFI
tara:strand:+ start:427 stop:1665 length:1239 start_codon:yes stop_codon:yes gene_type:complete